VTRTQSDFIVETAEVVYMCAPKASRNIDDADVQEKAIAAREYCRAASEFNAQNGGKPWVYVLIPHDEIRPQSSFGYLVKNSVPLEQTPLTRE
jgi:type III restriction enzyme